MTTPVDEQGNRIDYNPNGVQTDFAYDFQVNDADTIYIYADGVPYTEPYTIIGLEDPLGGLIQFDTAPLGSIANLTIQRILPLTQETVYPAFGPFPPKSHENALDKLTYIAQQLQEAINRSLRVTEGDPILDFTLPSVITRASKVLGFDSEGYWRMTESTVDQIDAAVNSERESGRLMISDFFTGDGVTTMYTLTAAPPAPSSAIVVIGGVIQRSSNYTLSGNVLTFSTAPPIDTDIEIRNLGYAFSVTPNIILEVQNIGVLRNTTMPEGVTAVQVLGYYTSGDGGGGPVRLYQSGRPVGTYVDNGGSVILPAGGDGSAAWVFDDTGRINVKWFGATGAYDQDDQPFIMNAINVRGGSDVVVYFPTGKYLLRSPIVITGAFVTLEGDFGDFKSIIYNGDLSDTYDCITFTTEAPTGNLDFNAGCGIRNLTINASSLRDSTAAIRVEKQTAFNLENMYIYNHAKGLDTYSFRTSTFRNFRIFYTGTTPDAGSSLLSIQTNDISEQYSDPWTSHFSNFVLGGTGYVDYGMQIKQADGIQIVNGYVSGFNIADIRAHATGLSCGNVHITNVYFDGGGDTVDYNFLVSNGAGAPNVWVFTNCSFNNPLLDCVSILDSTANGMTFSNCTFSYAQKAGISSFNSVALNLIVDGCSFLHCQRQSTGSSVLQLFHAETFQVTSSYFRGYTPLTGFIMAGSANYESGVITGNTFENYSGDIYLTGAFTNGLVIDNNTSDNGVVPSIKNGPVYFGGVSTALGVGILYGSGDPNGTKYAEPGSLYLNTSLIPGEYPQYQKRTASTTAYGWTGVGTAFS